MKYKLVTDPFMFNSGLESWMVIHDYLISRYGLPYQSNNSYAVWDCGSYFNIDKSVDLYFKYKKDAFLVWLLLL